MWGKESQRERKSVYDWTKVDCVNEQAKKRKKSGKKYTHTHEYKYEKPLNDVLNDAKMGASTLFQFIAIRQVNLV